MKRIGIFINTIKAYQGNKALGKAVSISMLNQMVSSGTNFALAIYMMRILPPAEFGIYGICFVVSTFYQAIGNALFLTQMVVHMPDKAQEDQLPYAGRMLLLVVLFCITTVFLFILMLLVDRIVSDIMVKYTGLAFAVMAASVSNLLNAFFVRHAYNVQREILVLYINTMVASVTVLLLWLQYTNFATFDVIFALWIYAASMASGALLGSLFSKLPMSGWSLEALITDFREAWQGGKWASIANGVNFARIHAHTIVVTMLLGPVGVAKLNATRLLVTPAIIAIPALSQIAMPRLVNVRQHGKRKLMMLGRLFMGALLLIALVYCAILLVTYDIIVNMVLGDKYPDVFWIIVFWCFYACLLAVRNSAEIVGQVLKQFKSLSGVNTVSAVVSLVAVYWLTVHYGLPGALIGLMAGEIILIAMLLLILTYC